ncbi:MAG: arginine deiminase family protein [candidate division Zixibacteria bacterium]|nr:arginine deiminase family protein [candidate division Zixibacteria bacterium]
MESSHHSEYGKIETILIKRPEDAFVSRENIDAQWQPLNYSAAPDFDKAVAEYDNFVSLLERVVPDVLYLPRNDRLGLDSIYARDALIATKKGIVLCNMGKEARQGEPEAAAEYLADEGFPKLGAITGEGRLEGGDLIWLDDRTLAVGRGYRTNDEGIRQLAALTAALVDELMVVPLPHWNGPAGVFHLMSMISPVDADLAVVYPRLLPIPFREWLVGRGMKFVEVPDEEYPTMACNVLALAPRKCLMLSGNALTKKRLEAAGAEVWEYDGFEISRKGAGGPTCLTRPLIRLA